MNEQVLDFDALAATAEFAAMEAGRLLRRKWTRPPAVSRKGFRDLVTDADVAVQERIRQIVSAKHPGQRFLGEENGAGHSDPAIPGETVWIVDPVDGTSNYSRHVPIFSVSIGVAHHSRLIVGVIYDPLRQELFRAVAGRGAYCGERRLSASGTPDPGNAILALDWGHSHEMRGRSLEILNRLAHQVQTIRALGSAALALAWLAAGRLDAYFNVSLKPWDVAAGSLILEEAGGRISRLDGAPCSWQEPETACLATNSVLHSLMLELIAERPVGAS